MKATGEGLLRELQRKAFHMLSLAYLAGYKLIGYPRVVPWLVGWSAVVVAVETARLKFPRLNDALVGFFSGLARASELKNYSGIVHTTLGALIVILAFGDKPSIVSASIFYVAFGDAAAAIFGKTFGRRRIAGGSKTIEGSLGCLGVCVLVGLGMGFGPLPLLCGAAAATAIELLPTTGWFNDNLWMPVATAVVLRVTL